MNPIYKFNSGNGAQLCVTCKTIIHAGEKSKHLLCSECQEKAIELLKSVVATGEDFIEIEEFLNNLEDE